jgi:hypothetical protein
VPIRVRAPPGVANALLRQLFDSQPSHFCAVAPEIRKLGCGAIDDSLIQSIFRFTSAGPMRADAFEFWASVAETEALSALTPREERCNNEDQNSICPVLIEFAELS